MRRRLLELIVCPYCMGKLGLIVFSEEDGNIIDGVLECRCKRKYPIIRGVPRILPDNVRWMTVMKDYPEYLLRYKDRVTDSAFGKKTNVYKLSLRTSKAFGEQWHTFSKFYPEDKENFMSWIKPTNEEFFKGKLVLDAGCGIGKQLYFSTEFGAETIGIDFSKAVDVAYELNKSNKMAHIVQADIYHLPFRKEMFDYIYSIGVIHHLPRQQEAFNRLLLYLKKGCPINTWVYGRENNGAAIYFVNPIRKLITSRLPKRNLLAVSKLLVIILTPVINANKTLNEMRYSRAIVQHFPLHSFLLYLSKLHKRNVLQITYDQLTAPKAIYYRKEQLAKWCKEANLENMQLDWRNRNSWCVYGEKR